MSTQIVDLIKSQQWSDIYELLALRNPATNLAIHDALIENCHVLEQYYFIKAFKLFAEDGNTTLSSSTYMQFAEDSISSIHGCKLVFANILHKLYENTDLNYPKLRYGHPLPEALAGVQPFLAVLQQVYP